MREIATIQARARKSHIWDRQTTDCYVEPEWCSRRLFEVEKFHGLIVDPACGIGRIVQSAGLAGHPVSGWDIAPRASVLGCHEGDFLESTAARPNIVSNPPFEIFAEFATHALKLAERKVALLWQVRTLPAARWLEQTPLKKIWLLTPRPSMPPVEVILRGEKPGGGKQDFCWLVFDKEHQGAPGIGWLRRDALAALATAAE